MTRKEYFTTIVIELELSLEDYFLGELSDVIIPAILLKGQITMQINLINSAEVMVLKTTGEIEIKEAEELKGYFSHLVAKATTIIIIDFERITFIGSLGIGKLLSLCKNVTLRKIPIEICKLNENLYNQSRQIIHSWEKTMIRFYPEKIQLLSGHGVYQALLHGTEYATSVIKTRDKTYLKILTVSGYYSLLFQAGELRK